MVDRDTAADWVGRYLAAWDSNDPADIRHAFTADAEYRPAPYDEPRRGHDELIAMWLDARDEPGDFTFTWEVAAIDSAVAVIRGRTEYVAGSAAGSTYLNLWLVRLTEDGRASDFTDWWVEVPQAAAPKSD